MKNKKIFTILIVLMCIPGFAKTLIVKKHDEKINCGYNINYFEDKAGTLDIHDILKRDDFIPLNKKYIQFGYTSSAYWLQMTIINETGEDRIIEVSHLNTDNVKFFACIDSKIIDSIENAGDRFPFSNRKIPDRRILFKIQKSTLPVTYFIRLESTTYLTMPILLWSVNALEKNEIIQLSIIYIYVLIMMLLLINKLIYFFALREKDLLFYVFIILVYSLNFLSFQGIAFPLFFSDNPEIVNIMPTVLPSIISIALLLFSKYFLDIKTKFPFLNFLIIAAISITIINIPAIIFFHTPSMYNALYLFTFTACVNICIYSLLQAIKGSIYHLFYFLSWVVIFITGAISFSYINGWIEYPRLNDWAIGIGSIIHIICISFGLTSKIGGIKKELELLKSKTVRKNSDTISKAAEQRVSVIVEYLDKNYFHEISREGLASMFSMSPDYISREFKSFTGKKISDYINELRIMESKKRLTETDETIITIAYEIGFENLRTFNRVFYKIMKTTPSEYKKSFIAK